MNVKGTEETREFYDTRGWQTSENGTTLDGDLFGVKEDGPLRKGMFDRKWARLRDRVKSGVGSEVLEVGCGGSPETRLFDLFDNYVGVDFSSTGLEVAESQLAAFKSRFRLVESDAVSLPFENDSFDAVYSAHMLYHIEDRAAQTAALSEMLRVLRPGGTLILQTANPRPLLFPARLIMRLIADTPLLNGIARRLKGPSPLPYNPRKLNWYGHMLRGCSSVEMFNGGIASTHFNQSVSEFSRLGKLIWSMFDMFDRRFPSTSAYLGNYVVFLTQK